MDVEFDPGTPAPELAAAVARIQGRIRERFPHIRRIYIEPRSADRS